MSTIIETYRPKNTKQYDYCHLDFANLDSKDNGLHEVIDGKDGAATTMFKKAPYSEAATVQNALSAAGYVKTSPSPPSSGGSDPCPVKGVGDNFSNAFNPECHEQFWKADHYRGTVGLSLGVLGVILIAILIALCFAIAELMNKKS